MHIKLSAVGAENNAKYEKTYIQKHGTECRTSFGSRILRSIRKSGKATVTEIDLFRRCYRRSKLNRVRNWTCKENSWCQMAQKSIWMDTPRTKKRWRPRRSYRDDIVEAMIVRDKGKNRVMIGKIKVPIHLMKIVTQL